jgi:protein FAM32A
MPPGDEYAAATSGTLKLKGVQGSKIDKKKKKKRKKKEGEEEEAKPATPEATADVTESGTAADAEGRHESDGAAYVGKTEAERRHEEMRRKRVSGAFGCLGGWRKGGNDADVV